MTDETIFFGKINEYYEKTDIKLVIDIDINFPIIEQLINTIPSIYRLNNEMIYCFEQVDTNSNIISYGEGVTRHVFNMLRKEIDILFENNLASKNNFLSTVPTEMASKNNFLSTVPTEMVQMKKGDCFKLGKLFYFCNRDGGETFFNIHPYFFYALSLRGCGKSDHITLLKKFKSDDFETYHKQYIRYLENPKELEDLDLDIKTAENFIEFLFTHNLTKEQIELYDKFIDGFCFFAH